MKLAAVIILFHPDVNLLLDNIVRFINDVDMLIVYKNSEEVIVYPEEYVSKIREMGTGINRYMAKVLNECVEYSIVEGYDYLLTMDQDSCWDDFASFKHEVEISQKRDTVVYAPNVNGIYPTLNSRIEVESVITSGSLCNISLVKRLGGFREDYKIYWVDSEFCHWARFCGYKIEVFTHYNLNQHFGNKTKTIGGFSCANYSPTVYYLMFRNMIWMRREYISVPSLKCIGYTSLFYIRGILLGEKRKIEKVYMILRGLISGLFGHFNRRVK